MKVVETRIPGVLIIEPKVWGDDRGYFLESYRSNRYAELGIPERLVQDNQSYSRRGVLRGLHIQHPFAQGKLVQVYAGVVFDVAVDVRRGSASFGRWVGVTLSGENKRQFWVPAGFAHGFQVVSETALFHYKCTALYAPKNEIGFRWDDPAVAIGWPLTPPILSKRDEAAPLLRDLPRERFF